MAPTGFETAAPASVRPQRHTFDCAANGIGCPLASYHVLKIGLHPTDNLRFLERLNNFH